MGHAVGALGRPDTLEIKQSKFATEMGSAALRAFGFNNKADFVEKKLYLISIDATLSGEIASKVKTRRRGRVGTVVAL